jgi:ABC-type polysaccharide/polyol phosphate export permease
MKSKLLAMTNDKNIRNNLLDEEAPRVKDFVVVLVVIAVLIVLSWLAYYKFHFGDR